MFNYALIYDLIYCDMGQLISHPHIDFININNLNTTVIVTVTHQERNNVVRAYVRDVDPVCCQSSKCYLCGMSLYL